MPVIPAELVHSNPGLDAEQIIAKLLGGETLLSDTSDHLIEVVDVLESYGEVLDAYRNAVAGFARVDSRA